MSSPLAEIVDNNTERRYARRTVSGARLLMVTGGVLMLLGAVSPWFVVGPASRTGVADVGWWCVIGGLSSLVGSAVVRFDGSGRWLVFVGVVSMTIAVLWALLTPPSGMTFSAGPFICLLGAGLAITGSLIVVRDASTGVESGQAGEAGEAGDVDASDHGRPMVAALRWLGGVAVVVVGVVVIVAAWPIDTDGLGADPEAVDGYETAIQRFSEITADEPDFVFEPCRSRLYEHGERTEVVVVLFHGLTNCPRQYWEMAEVIHQQGANVVVMRAPGHGHATGDGTEIAGAGALHSLTARQLADYADDSVDIAVGLGDQVRVHGLSMGGVISLWVAQHRPEVERVVAMAPAFEIPGVPNAVTTAFTNLFSRTPSFTLSHERHIDHDYAAFSTRGLAASFALGQAVMVDGLDVGPVVDDVTVVLNPDDPLVTESDIIRLVETWDLTDDVGDVVVLDTDGLPHDGIDVAQPEADPDAVYPTVLNALGYTWVNSLTP